MNVDLSRLKIGIDRIVLNNFEITNFKDLQVQEIKKGNELQERLIYKNKYYTLTCTKKSNMENIIDYVATSLEFNPNKIRDNHNLYNSSILELQESIEKVTNDLKENGIMIDLENCTIKEIEINRTIDIDFDSLSDVILLIGRANHKKALGIYKFNAEFIPFKIIKDKCLYLNPKSKDFTKNLGKKIKIYDKTFELERQQDIHLDKNLTRIEVLFGQNYFRDVMTRLGLTNSLKDFISYNDLESLFLDSLERELVTKPAKHLIEIKKHLTYEFNNFRRNEAVKRKYRKELKEKGLEIPKEYIEQRGVFEHLKQYSWIFDFSFLLEIVQDKIENKNRFSFERQILKKYINYNHLTRYKEFIEKISN